MTSPRLQRLGYLALAGVLAAAGCGGSGRSSSVSSSGGGGGGGGSSGSNVLAITVNTGPNAGPPNNSQSIDTAFASVTVCVPGSTSNCDTINDVLVDTGSSGLRILASALTISLPQQTGAGGNPVVECLPFIDGFTWGPVQTADLTVAGEHAQKLPIQVVGSSKFPSIPSSCSSNGPAENDLKTLGANGILGVGLFAQDCGGGCTVGGASNAGFYYTCASSGCSITPEALASQVQNPVAFFAADNNGVIVELPAVAGTETSVSGSLIFGIGTQSNNGLGSATVYTLDPSSGNLTTRFNNTTYQNAAFLDTGSNAIYFLNSTTTGIPACKDLTFWYCPGSTQNLSATNEGANGASGTFDFVVGNADTLVANFTIGVANGLAGPNSGTFDWGLPFFFGRKVFTAIEGRTTPGGVGPYVAY
jgi:Protein of unknown function (DUF3443)